MNNLIVNGFDYSVIDEVCRDDVRDAAVRIKVRMARTAADIIDIGRDLISVKESVGHGNFLPWIDAEFGMTYRTAQRFMSVAERVGTKSDTMSHLPPTALYALTSPSTPEDIVEEVANRAASGEVFTAADIKAMKDAWASEKKELKDKATRADSIKHDFGQQLLDLQNKLAASRDEADTLKHELERAKVPSTDRIDAPVAQLVKPDRHVIQEQANAIINAWNKACPDARDIALEQIDAPVFDSTRAARG